MEDEDTTQGEEPVPRQAISSLQLVEAMGDVSKFRNIYLTLTKKAIVAYEACGKINSVLRLKADIAGLALSVYHLRVEVRNDPVAGIRKNGQLHTSCVGSWRRTAPSCLPGIRSLNTLLMVLFKPIAKRREKGTRTG